MSDVLVETLKSEPAPVVQYEQKTAGFWMRFWAYTLDALVVSAIIGLTMRPLFAVMDWSVAEDVWYAPAAIISAVIYYTYFVLMTKFFKQTLGKMVFGLYVQQENGQVLDWGTVLFREGIGRFINNCLLYLPYLIVAFTPHNKSVADYVADTRIVHEKVYKQQV